MKLRILVITLLIPTLLIGCASNPNRQSDIVEKSASNIQPTREKLSNFSNITLAPMKVIDDIKNNSAKMAYAEQLETKLQNEMQTVLTEWNNTSSGSNRNLIIEPELLSLRIVSGGARFWAGGLAGNSSINLKLVIKDAKTGAIIGSPVIDKESNAIAGAYSFGSSDKNLLNYIAKISVQYLKNNY